VRYKRELWHYCLRK